jgi:hypothetical protein
MTPGRKRRIHCGRQDGRQSRMIAGLMCGTPVPASSSIQWMVETSSSAGVGPARAALLKTHNIERLGFRGRITATGNEWGRGAVDSRRPSYPRGSICSPDDRRCSVTPRAEPRVGSARCSTRPTYRWSVPYICSRGVRIS